MHNVNRKTMVGLLLFTAAFAIAQEHAKDSIDQIKNNLKDKKAVLLDVREQAEWDAGHLKAAELLPLSKIKSGADPKDTVKGLKQDTIIYCHCRAGKRALDAAKLLRKKGYDVRALKQGYDELVKSGLESSSKLEK